MFIEKNVFFFLLLYICSHYTMQQINEQSHIVETDCAVQIVSEDQVDSAAVNVYDQIVFDSTGAERAPWSLCGRKTARSQVVFASQLLVIFIVDVYCMVKLSFGGNSCEENTIYCMILSASLTYLLPSPTKPTPPQNKRGPESSNE